MFNIAKKNSRAEEERVKVETLTLFCLNRYRTFFFLSPELAKRMTRRRIEEWTKQGKIDKRICQMWKARKA